MTEDKRYLKLIGQRLRDVRTKLGFQNREQFADAYGSPKKTFEKYEQGVTELPTRLLLWLSKEHRVSLDWLMTGVGDMLDRGLAPNSSVDIDSARSETDAPDFSGGAIIITDMQRPNLVTIPRYDVFASAGQGLLPVEETKMDLVAFDARFLRDLGANPAYCTVIAARGDSMTPTIPDGSLLVVDRSQTEIANGVISVLNMDGELVVKRLRRRLGGVVEIVSDNPAYPVDTIRADRADGVSVVGRVVYFCRAP